MAPCSSKSDSVGRAGAPSDSERFECLGNEQILRVQTVLREALFVRVPKEGRKRLAIAIEPVRPEIISHLAGDLVEMGDEPWQHGLERGGLAEIGVGLVPRRQEGFQKRLRYPAMAL